MYATLSVAFRSAHTVRLTNELTRNASNSTHSSSITASTLRFILRHADTTQISVLRVYCKHANIKYIKYSASKARLVQRFLLTEVKLLANVHSHVNILHELHLNLERHLFVFVKDQLLDRV